MKGTYLLPLKLQLNAEIKDLDEKIKDLKKVIEIGKQKITLSRKRDTQKTDKIPKVNKADEELKSIEEICNCLIAIDENVIEFKNLNNLNAALKNYLGNHPVLHSAISVETESSDSEEEIEIKSLSKQERVKVVKVSRFLKYLIEHEYDLSEFAYGVLPIRTGHLELAD